MERQENVGLVGTATGDGDRLSVRVARALNDWSLAGNRRERNRSFLGQGKMLRKPQRRIGERAVRRAVIAIDNQVSSVLPRRRQDSHCRNAVSRAAFTAARTAKIVARTGRDDSKSPTAATAKTPSSSGIRVGVGRRWEAFGAAHRPQTRIARTGRRMATTTAAAPSNRALPVYDSAANADSSRRNLSARFAVRIGRPGATVAAARRGS